MYIGGRALASVVLLLGLALLAVGLFLGFTSVTASGIDCGSAFSPDRAAQYSYFAPSGACEDATTGRKPVALGLSVTGGALAFVGLIGLGMTYTQMKERRRQEGATVPSELG